MSPLGRGDIAAWGDSLKLGTMRGFTVLNYQVIGTADKESLISVQFGF